jgi:hypothetical protein
VPPTRKADNLTAICQADCLENVGSSTSHNPIGTRGLISQGIETASFSRFSRICVGDSDLMLARLLDTMPRV